MSRIGARFAALRRDARKALIPYLMAGDPEPSVTVSAMHAMVEAGADLIELGVPFSDPMADGPVIQLACERALAHRVSLRDVLVTVGRFRQQDTTTPIILMGYLNPLERMGYEAFAEAVQQAGVDGVLTVDVPPEEAEAITAPLIARDIDPIFLLAPTSTSERLQRICLAARGFVYYVSLKGVTGAATLDVNSVAQKVGEIRGYTDLPIGVGFGIRDAESAARIARVADAVVVGSAVVKHFAEHAHEPAAIIPAVQALLRSMRSAMDAS